MIIFVYDTGFCQTEEDDPQKAVLFFHPKWVSDQQRLALCGQLMGAAHFCSSVFSTPQVLTLQSGKFILKKFNNYILSVGSDQTLPDWILNERFHVLQSIIEFYHKSFDTILASCNSEYELFSKKLCDIFEVYSPLIEYFVSTFGNVPAIKFPRKKSTMFLEAYQLLESCCTYDGVLGGTILHNSRVIATLLDSDITKILALTDPHRVRCDGEQINTPFRLPLGVQLLKVYVKHSVYESAENLGNIKPSVSSELTKKSENTSEAKQELTKIFTVPEEDNGNSIQGSKKDAKEQRTWELSRRRLKKHCRSKLENALRERSRNLVTNYNIKVCSTPTIEKKVIHEDLVSICSNTKTDARPTPQVSFIPELMQSAKKTQQPNIFLPSRYSHNYLYRLSVDDLMIDFTYKSHPVPLRYYSVGLPRITKDIDLSVKDEQKKKLLKTRFYQTIADPSNPVFRYDGFPISKSLYKHCLDEHYKDFITANITIDSREEFIRKKNLENELFKLKRERKIKGNETNQCESAKRLQNDVKFSKNDKINAGENPEMREKELSSKNQKLFRRSLTLPLKPMTFIGNENSVPMSVVKLHARTPTTPLMTKLSLLVLEEQSECNFGSDSKAKSRSNRESSVKKKPTRTVESKNPDITSCGLFVCGHGNLTMLLLLDESVQQNPDLILSLWDLCAANLDRVEMFRSKSSDYLANSGVSSSYSFLSLDPEWGTTQKSGAWGNDEIKLVGSLHQDLIQSPNITEVIVRNEDAVVYVYRCGNTEIFYHQGGCSTIGLPTPADLMGVIPLKARRRLERDHGVILL